MAKPIEPNRWEEFPSKRAARSTPYRLGPPPDVARSANTARTANTATAVDAATAVDTALTANWVVADFGVKAIGCEPPIPVVAGLVGQIAVHVSNATGGEVDEDADADVDVDVGLDLDGDLDLRAEPRSLSVDVRGVVSVPSGFIASGYDLLMLFAELIGDQPVPPSIARLLLAKTETEVSQLTTALEPLGSASEIAEFMAQQDALNGIGSGTGDMGGEGSRPESPIAKRAAGSSARESGNHGGGGGVRRKVAALAGVLAVLAVGALALIGGEPGGPSEVASTTPVTVAPEQTNLPRPVAVSATATTPSTDPEVVGATLGATPYPTSWAALLAKLDSSRAVAFSTGEQELLADVNIAGSPAAQMDEQMLDDLKQIGAVARGLGSKIDGVELISASASEARLAVDDVLGAYQIVAKSDGSVIESRKQRAQQSWEVTLRPVDGQWRIYHAAPR